MGVTAAQVGATIGDHGQCTMWRAAVSAGVGSVVISTGGPTTFFVSSLSACGWMITGNASNVPSSIGTLDANTVNNVDPQGPLSSLTVPSGGVGVVFIGGDFNAVAGRYPFVWTPAAVVRDAITESQFIAGNGCSIAGAHITAASTYTTIGGSGTSAPWQYSSLIGAAWA
jgi:hypothetical protein